MNSEVDTKLPQAVISKEELKGGRHAAASHQLVPAEECEGCCTELEATDGDMTN